MHPEHRQALEFVNTSNHILWDEVNTPVRHLLCDLLLDKLLTLDYYNGFPYAFVVSEDGRRVLQAISMGAV